MHIPTSRLNEKNRVSCLRQPPWNNVTIFKGECNRKMSSLIFAKIQYLLAFYSILRNFNIFNYYFISFIWSLKKVKGIPSSGADLDPHPDPDP
jgi:hypothetical protein